MINKTKQKHKKQTPNKTNTSWGTKLPKKKHQKQKLSLKNQTKQNTKKNLINKTVCFCVFVFVLKKKHTQKTKQIKFKKKLIHTKNEIQNKMNNKL